MRFWQGALRFLLCASAAIPIEAASSWGFGDATVSVQTKGAGVGAGLKEKYVCSLARNTLYRLYIVDSYN